MDEYNIVDDKTPEEKKVERLGREIQHMIDGERLRDLVNSEFADIDIIIGVLFQTKGLLRSNRRFADDVEEHVTDMLTIAEDMVRCINKKQVKKKKVKKDE